MRYPGQRTRTNTTTHKGSTGGYRGMYSTPSMNRELAVIQPRFHAQKKQMATLRQLRRRRLNDATLGQHQAFL